MRLLLDTHLLLSVGKTPERLSPEAIHLITDPANAVTFSVASIWEVAIKSAKRRPDFDLSPHLFRGRMLREGYEELPIAGEHAAAVAELPRLHGDPFDRLLVAQAKVEGLTLLTADRALAQYPGPIRIV